jgi:hypothetical protein
MNDGCVRIVLLNNTAIQFPVHSSTLVAPGLRITETSGFLGIVSVARSLVQGYYVVCLYHRINLYTAKLPFLHPCQMYAYRYNVVYSQTQT